MSELVVAQADRDAAADQLARMAHVLGWDNAGIKAVRDGGYDSLPLVQAFARHRQAALEEAIEWAAERARVALEAGGDAPQKARRIADEIRNLIESPSP